MITDNQNQEAEYEDGPKYDEYPGDPVEEVTIEGLLLAALGLPIPKVQPPLQFTGKYQGREVKMLVDSGSSINLLSNKLCQDLKLQTKTQAVTKIQLPNGGVMECREPIP